MSGNLQPKGLFELAFKSFITYMENEARQLMKLEPSPQAVAVASRVCSELKRFFHGTRLPTSMTNQLTKHLLIKLDSMYDLFKSAIQTECCQQMLLSLVEVFMHPDVTAIELGQSYFHEFDFTPCNFITWNILQKVCVLRNLKILNLPAVNFYLDKEFKPVFPCQLKELTVRCIKHRYNLTRTLYTDILRSIVEFCPELKSLTMCDCHLYYQDITLILQCKHLEALRLSDSYFPSVFDVNLNLIYDLSTDATTDLLSASTVKSFYVSLGHQSSLSLIVDKLPHLTEIELLCVRNVDLSSLTQLKNLRSLSLEAFHDKTENEYKKILPVLGKNLVFLELRGHCALDLEFIGETCTHLKCFHFCDVSLPKNLNPLKTIPNFKTIECLNITSRDAKDFLAYLIAQCINIKSLIVNYNDIRNSTIEDVLRRTPPLDLVVIEHNPEGEFDSHFIESLPARHPNFHVVKSPVWMRLSSQADIFDSFGCYR